MNQEQKIVLGNIEGILRREKGGVRVHLAEENVILPNLDVASASAVITRNFDVVCQHYHYAMVNGEDITDGQRISVSIVLYYLCMYNNWRNLYPKMSNLDLSFKAEDFENPVTYDIISHYCKRYYPSAWMEKVGVRLGKTVDAVRQYEAGRQLYYNK